MANIPVTQKKLNGGIIGTPGDNVNLWYTRESLDKFSLNGSFSGLETKMDWIILKETDSKFIKCNVVKFNTDAKTFRIKFDSPFADNNYSVFFCCNSNVNMFWSDKTKDKFVINSSFAINGELSWIAIHNTIGKQTGLRTPKTIYVGQRTLNFDSLTWNGTAFVSGESALDMSKLPMSNSELENGFPSADSAVNLQGWFKNEYIIKPTTAVDGIAASNLMNFTKASDYSVIISSDTNINMFYKNKGTDRVKVGTSFSRSCVINYLFIKTGLNWWNEI